MRVLSATAPIVTFGRAITGQIPVTDPTGQLIGVVDLIRGFARYTGVRGGPHFGFSATIYGGLDGLARELAKGITNGRRDDQR